MNSLPISRNASAPWQLKYLLYRNAKDTETRILNRILLDWPPLPLFSFSAHKSAVVRVARSVNLITVSPQLGQRTFRPRRDCIHSEGTGHWALHLMPGTGTFPCHAQCLFTLSRRFSLSQRFYFIQFN